MRLRSLLGKAAVAVLSLLVVTGGGLGIALTSGVVSVQQPTVEAVHSEWGEVNAETTEVRTDVTVNNPNAVDVPGIVDLRYAVAVNDVTVGEGTKRDVGLGSGRSTVSLSTRIDNEKIPTWWASHVNNGERTTMAVRPTVKAPFVSKSLPAQERTFSTDILSAFERNETRELSVGGRPVLRATETTASWGTATRERTQLTFAATVENPGEGSVSLSKLGYTITMNDVTVAEGTTDGVRVAPNETERLRVDAALNNGKLPQWWTSHVENGERTTMDAQFYALTDANGETKRVPLSFLSERVVFTTDVLGGGETTTKTLSGGPSTTFTPPNVSAIESEWVVPEEGDTRVRTSAVVENPNAEFAGTVALETDYSVRMNDATLASRATRRPIDAGRNELAFSSAISDREVQAWWVSHVNGGERTKRVVERDVTADAGFASVSVDHRTTRGAFETDMLDGIDGEATQTLSVRGQRLGSVSNGKAAWGRATMAETPVETSVGVTNQRSESFEIVGVGRPVSMNGVVLAHSSAAKSAEIAPGETTTVEDTVTLNNSKLGAWWKTHLRRGEQSTMTVSYHVVVEYRGHTERIALDAMSYERTVTTDLLGNAN